MRRWDLWLRGNADGQMVVFTLTDVPWWLRALEWLSDQCLPEVPIPLIGRIVVNRKDPVWRCTLAEWVGDGNRVTIDDLWHDVFWTRLRIADKVHRCSKGGVEVPVRAYLDAVGDAAEPWIVSAVNGPKDDE